MQIVDRSNSEHYSWGDVCDGWHLLKRDDLSIITERVSPGASEQRHFHVHSRQFFYILTGSATIEVDGVRHSLVAQQGIEIPPGMAHQFWNESNSDATFLVISMPKAHGDRYMMYYSHFQPTVSRTENSVNSGSVQKSLAVAAIAD